MKGRRVVITGLGAVTGFGCGMDETWNAIVAGKSALRRYYPLGDSTQPAEVASEVDWACLPEFVQAEGLGKAARFGLAAAREAWLDAGLTLPCEEADETGVCVGASTFPVIEDRLDKLGSLLKDGRWDVEAYARLCRERSYLLTQSDAAGISSLLSELVGGRGLSMTVQAACTSSTQAIGYAFEALRAGQGKVMLTGGTDSMLSMMCVTGFRLLGSLGDRWTTPEEASRPFDRTRDGFVLAEGAAMLVLEDLEHARARGARVYAEMIGYGSSCDAYRFTDMEPEGRGPVQCMRNALADAGIEPAEVGYVNAHGTATQLNDRIESSAIREVFGGHADAGLAVSSTKSQVGHLLCAAGGIEMALTALAVHRGVLPPTLNLKHRDAECDLRYVGEQALEHQVDVAISNSFGFGGQNGTLVVRRWAGFGANELSVKRAPRKRVCVTGWGVRSPLGMSWAEHRDGWTTGRSGLTTAGEELQKLGVMRAGQVREEETGIRNRMLRKILTRAAGFAVGAAGEALRTAKLECDAVDGAELYVGSLGLDQDLNVFAEALTESMEEGNFSYGRFRRLGTALIDPLFLVRSLPNAGLCGTAIEFGMRGRNLNITNGATSGMLAVATAAASIGRGDTKVAVAGGYDSLIQLETLLGHMGGGGVASEGQGRGYLPGEGAVFVVLEERESALARGATILGEITGWGWGHTPSEEAADGLERAARVSLRGIDDVPRAVFGDGLGVAGHDAIEAEAMRRLGVAGVLDGSVGRLGYAGGVTGLYSLLHGLEWAGEAGGPVLAWTCDRGRNHVSLALAAAEAR